MALNKNIIDSLRVISSIHTHKDYLVVHYLSIGLHQGLCIKGCFSIKHFIHANTKRPPVTLGAIFSFSIFHGLQDFWRDVVWCSNCYWRLNLKQWSNPLLQYYICCLCKYKPVDFYLSKVGLGLWRQKRQEDFLVDMARESFIRDLGYLKWKGVPHFYVLYVFHPVTKYQKGFA